jgi:hypothetical protein
VFRKKAHALHLLAHLLPFYSHLLPSPTQPTLILRLSKLAFLLLFSEKYKILPLSSTTVIITTTVRCPSLFQISRRASDWFLGTNDGSTRSLKIALISLSEPHQQVSQILVLTPVIISSCSYLNQAIEDSS